jgi:hypothetical protein
VPESYPPSRGKLAEEAEDGEEKHGNGAGLLPRNHRLRWNVGEDELEAKIKAINVPRRLIYKGRSSQTDIGIRDRGRVDDGDGRVDRTGLIFRRCVWSPIWCETGSRNGSF